LCGRASCDFRGKLICRLGNDRFLCNSDRFARRSDGDSLFAIAIGFFAAAPAVAAGFFVNPAVAATAFVVDLAEIFVVGLFVVVVVTGFFGNTTVGVAVFVVGPFEICFANTTVLAGAGGVVATGTGSGTFAALRNRPDVVDSGGVILC